MFVIFVYLGIGLHHQFEGQVAAECFNARLLR
jgi:hypothetical protein